MFKKPIRIQPKTTNIKNVKATLAKHPSQSIISQNKFHSQSTFDYPQQNKQRTLPIFDNLIDQLQHSHSQLLFSTKNTLKSTPKENLNQSYSRGKLKLNLEKPGAEVNLPNLKKSVKKGFNETSKRALTPVAQDENKLNLTRMKMRDKNVFGEMDEQNRKLRIVNKHLEEQNEALIDTLKKYEMRERTLMTQLKQREKQQGGCQQHIIIIQSLKRVIDSQLEKIIQLQRQIILSGDNKDKEKQNTKQKFKFKEKSIQDYTPNFAPSSPKRVVFDDSNNSTEQDMNMYIEYVDTFRRDKGKQKQKERQKLREKSRQREIEIEKQAQYSDEDEVSYNPSLIETKQKQPFNNLTINSDTQFADDLLCEIDDCLDSLSRRKRQLL